MKIAKRLNHFLTMVAYKQINPFYHVRKHYDLKKESITICNGTLLRKIVR